MNKRRQPFGRSNLRGGSVFFAFVSGTKTRTKRVPVVAYRNAADWEIKLTSPSEKIGICNIFIDYRNCCLDDNLI